MSNLGPESDRQRFSDIKCVLFDLDGTLINTIDLICRSFDHAVQNVLGQKLSRQELLKNIGRPLMVQMRNFSEDKAEQLMDAYNQHNLAHHDQHVFEYPQTAATLNWLKYEKELKIGVVTSKVRDLSLRGLKLTGLLKFIDTVVAMEDTKVHKPSPDPVKEALKRLDCGANESLFVGDSPFDIDAGKSAGVLSGAALWGPFSPEELRAHNADFELLEISDIRQCL